MDRQSLKMTVSRTAMALAVGAAVTVGTTSPLDAQQFDLRPLLSQHPDSSLEARDQQLRQLYGTGNNLKVPGLPDTTGPVAPVVLSAPDAPTETLTLVPPTATAGTQIVDGLRVPTPLTQPQTSRTQSFQAQTRQAIAPVARPETPPARTVEVEVPVEPAPEPTAIVETPAAPEPTVAPESVVTEIVPVPAPEPAPEPIVEAPAAPAPEIIADTQDTTITPPLPKATVVPPAPPAVPTPDVAEGTAPDLTPLAAPSVETPVEVVEEVATDTVNDSIEDATEEVATDTVNDSIEDATEEAAESVSETILPSTVTVEEGTETVTEAIEKVAEAETAVETVTERVEEAVSEVATETLPETVTEPLPEAPAPEDVPAPATISAVEPAEIETPITVPTQEAEEYAETIAAARLPSNPRPLTEEVAPAPSLTETEPPVLDELETTEPAPETQSPIETAALAPDTSPLALDVPDETQLTFNVSSATLSDRSARVLDGIAGRLAQSDERLQIRAYARDADGRRSASRRLSLSRALAVRSYLIEKGIDSRRIDVRALGIPEDDSFPERVDLSFIAIR